MKIHSNIENNYTKQNNVGFNANKRLVTDAAGEILYKNNTWFFRNDLNWDKFSNLLIEKYKDTPKVHIRNYACSEGAESASLVMILIKKLGLKKAQKFFPIIASDFDPVILENPQKGILKLSQGDLWRIEKRIGRDFSEFIEIESSPRAFFNEVVYSAKMKPILRDAIKFEEKDILNDLPSITSENSVVLCRNFWPYLSLENQHKLADILSKKLGQNSMFVLGSSDALGVEYKNLFIPRGINLRKTIGHSLYYEIPESSKKTSFEPEYLMRFFANTK